MKKLFLIMAAILISGCAFHEQKMVRQMDIRNVNVQNVRDGEYVGSFTYSGFEYKVRTMVKAHRIVNIEILQNRATKHAKLAEGVIPEIIEKQTPDVDAISGATTTSKALMKAVENSLTANPS